MNNLIGQSVGRYHILEQLGEGGMATVYKAFDTRLETEVAVKVIRTDNILPRVLERAIKRFDREAKALAKLTHANIVKVIDYGEYDGKPYLVMPFLPGGTLKERLKGKPSSWQEAARLLIPIARALDFAHRQGMVHRDVKPSNIIITADGDPMLTDFGIAKILDLEETVDLTGTNATVGTPEYMAPEQTTSNKTDHRVDIYALGVVFYEMVTGRKPYIADTPMAVLIKHASEPLPRPKQFTPDLPQAVENILLKALAKNPEDRYQNMGEFVMALERLVSGKVSKANLAGTKQWTIRFGNRGIAFWIILGIVGISLAGLIVGLFLNQGAVELAPAVLTSPIAISQEVTRSVTKTNVPINTPSLNPTTTNIPNTLAFPNPTQVMTQTNVPISSAKLEQPVIYDDFDDPVWDGKFNSNLWVKRENCTSISQEDSSMVFRNRDSGCDLIMAQPRKVKGDELGSLEARLKVSSDHRGGIVTQEIDFFTYDLPGGLWYSFCGVFADNNRAKILFSVENPGAKKSPELQKTIPAKYDQWYVIRLEVDPQTMRFSCFVDGVSIGGIVPKDAEALRSVQFERLTEAMRFQGASATTFVDYIKLLP